MFVYYLLCLFSSICRHSYWIDKNDAVGFDVESSKMATGRVNLSLRWRIQNSDIFWARIIEFLACIHLEFSFIKSEIIVLLSNLIVSSGWFIVSKPVTEKYVKSSNSSKIKSSSEINITSNRPGHFWQDFRMQIINSNNALTKLIRCLIEIASENPDFITSEHFISLVEPSFDLKGRVLLSSIKP